MPNDIANNMADTIHQLEEDRIMLSAQLTDLQIAYNEQMLELKEAKRLLKVAVEDIHQDKCDTCTQEIDCKFCCCEGLYKWRYAAEALALVGEDGEQNG